MDNLTRFGRDKAGYTEKKVTQTQGDLYLDGVLFRANLPFPLIQYERAKLLRQGFTTRQVTIKYHQK